MHYQRWTRTGDPEGQRGWRGASWLARFYARIDTSGGADACHPWTGARNEHGYGVVNTKGRRGQQRAHRVLMEVETTVEVPEGLEVLHDCDNPPCCNRRHLRIDTHAVNMDDMVARQRRGRKFSDAVLLDVLTSDCTHRELREKYGISSSYVTLIRQQYRPGMNRSFTA